ncbi:MAG: hypothetical protein JRH19_18690 [Deltaproteobacteria bacterium]|nr:hypothetical protein [Deltaproteobacteria bacterium]
MISSFDDYMIHQVSIPVNQPETSDRNFYDRHWLNGYDREGDFIFESGFAIYPNRRVMDGHFSISVDGVQHSFHGSRRAPHDRAESQVGPFHLEIVTPLRELRLRLEPNETGIECDLLFRATTAPVQEPKNVMHDELRLIMDTTRLTQLGTWEGHITVKGQRREVNAATTLGTRDRSWGVRPVGEPEAGAPGLLTTEPGVYWVWCPIVWDNGICTQFGTFEDHDGKATQVGGAVVPMYESMDDIPKGEDPGHREVVAATHKIHWKKGTRLAESAEIEIVTQDGEKLAMTMEPVIRFHMLGIGYQHPEWGHGHWKGEEAIGGESWKLDELDLLDYKHIHNHQIVRARMGERSGVGTLETVCFGRHDPSGFKSILDGAT